MSIRLSRERENRIEIAVPIDDDVHARVDAAGAALACVERRGQVGGVRADNVVGSRDQREAADIDIAEQAVQLPRARQDRGRGKQISRGIPNADLRIGTQPVSTRVVNTSEVMVRLDATVNSKPSVYAPPLYSAPGVVRSMAAAWA